MESKSTSMSSTVGTSIPFQTLHSLIVSFPTWDSNVGWMSADPEVVKITTTGYPRFFVHKIIIQVADMCLERLDIHEQLVCLFPTATAADECLSYLVRCGDVHESALGIHMMSLKHPNLCSVGVDECLPLYVVHFPVHLQELAKLFWQHTGMGISSRYGELCLQILTESEINCALQFHGAEKYQSSSKPAFRVLQCRIAELAATGHATTGPILSASSQLNRPSPTGDDVFLYPTGMSAIWHAHQLVLSLQPELKCVCFGFIYMDTNKVLEKWGPGSIFFENDPDTNLEELETFLKSTDSPRPISALFCECTSNPLLQSSDLPRLRDLANEYGFLIIVDNTIGTFVNVDVLQYVDIIATSLSKLFSGGGNVMGGSLVINPQSKHYASIKNSLKTSYIDEYFPPDVVQMELNSRDFEARVHATNANTRAICHYLHARSLSHDACNEGTNIARPRAIKQVLYPEWITRRNYDLVRRSGHADNFGSLFTLTFVSHRASVAFFDALGCAKGPSFGTDFTLACPYTILAHYSELEWAAQCGVEEGLVRVSIGVEEESVLMEWFQIAVKAAEDVVNVVLDENA